MRVSLPYALPNAVRYGLASGEARLCRAHYELGSDSQLGAFGQVLDARSEGCEICEREEETRVAPLRERYERARKAELALRYDVAAGRATPAQLRAAEAEVAAAREAL